MEMNPDSMQVPIDASKVVAAFVKASMRQWSKHKHKHKWIPVTYWSRKLNKMLKREDITPAFLCKALKRGIDRRFAEPDQTIYKDIQIIKSVERTINKKRQVFLQVVIEPTQVETIPKNKDDAAGFFLKRLQEFNNRKSIFQRPVIETNQEILPAPRTVTPTAFEEVFEEASSLATRVKEATMANDPKSQRTTTTTESTRESQPTMIESQRTGPFGALRDLFSKFINPQYVDREDFFMGTPEEATMAIEAFAAEKVNKHHEIFDNGHGSDNDLATKVLDTSIYLPCFNKYALPFRKSVVNDLIHCFVKLAEEVPDTLHLIKQSGSKGLGRRLIAVIPCTDNSPAHFNQNAKQWMPSLFSALGTDAGDKYFVCFHLLNLLRWECTEAFEDLCRTKSTMANTFKMDPLRQMAMFSECNLTYNQGRVMRQFFIADKCNPLLSERAIRKLEVQLDVMPICSTFQEHKMKRNAWFIPVDKKVIAMLEKRTDLSEVSELHAILSADHGQGAFRVNVTVLLLVGGRIVFEEHMLVGHIQCKHDTADILVESGVIGGINDSLVQLKEYSDEKFLADRFRRAVDSNLCLPCCPAPGLIPFPVKLLAVGDLAWYSLALGKEKMSGHHCFRCKAMGTAFKHDPSKQGEPWTLTGMREQYARLERGELNVPEKQCGLTVAQQRLGVKQPMLINCIEPKDYLSPVLHAVTLLVNTPFDFLKRYIWYRMDDIPLKLMTARQNIIREELEVAACWTDKLEGDMEYNALKIKLIELKPARPKVFDNDEHRNEYHDVQSKVHDCKKEVERRKKRHEDAGKALKKAKKTVSNMEQNHTDYGKVTRDLWMSIERMLKADFNVYASTYHGGDMEGNQCRNLMRNASNIMAKIKDILLKFCDSLTPEQQARRASPNEIHVYCQGFERLFQYMDLISHYCYQPYGSMTDADVEDAKRAIDLGTGMWHRLLPTVPMKVHVWQHLKDDLEKYRGLESHHEQQVERAHQEGKKNERRLGAVQDFEKKTMVILKHNSMTASTGVQAKIADTKKQSKGRSRKRKRAEVDVDSVQEERAKYLKSILQLPELTHSFATLHQLEIATYHQQRQEEAGTGDAIGRAPLSN